MDAFLERCPNLKAALGAMPYGARLHGLLCRGFDGRRELERAVVDFFRAQMVHFQEEGRRECWHALS